MLLLPHTCVREHSLAQSDPLSNASIRKGSGDTAIVQMEFGGRV